MTEILEAPVIDLEALMSEQAEKADKCDCTKCSKEAVYVVTLARKHCSCEPQVDKSLLCLFHATEYKFSCMFCFAELTITSCEPVRR
jgi:hypothetical protein